MTYLLSYNPKNDLNFPVRNWNFWIKNPPDNIGNICNIADKLSNYSCSGRELSGVKNNFTAEDSDIFPKKRRPSPYHLPKIDLEAGTLIHIRNKWIFPLHIQKH